jgi:hypothetical protein
LVTKLDPTFTTMRRALRRVSWACCVIEYDFGRI